MILKSILRYGLMVLLLLVIATPGYSGGIGMFISGGTVEAEWDGDIRNFDSDGKHRDFCFTVDSNLDSGRPFNYRLELGRARCFIDYLDNQGTDTDLEGLVMNHDFGFGGMVAPLARLCFGREIRFTILEGKLDKVVAGDIDLFDYGVGASGGFKTDFVMMRYLGDGPNLTGTS